MPNSYLMAGQQNPHLFRKFKKDDIFAGQYEGFMDEVIKKGCAEKVPRDQLQQKEGRLWYIGIHLSSI